MFPKIEVDSFVSRLFELYANYFFALLFTLHITINAILLLTSPNSEIICGHNVGTKVVCGIIFFFEKKAMLKI